jgi:hypothetical protein
VTRGAANGDPSVVILGYDRKAYRARMAHLARRDRRNVARWLSGSNRTLMAIRTRCSGRNVGMINLANVIPPGSPMACLTLLVRRHMVLWLAGHPVVVVTIKAKFHL